MDRADVSFGADVAGWLYEPPETRACVVMAHGLAAVRDQALPAYAERFAAAGLAVLLFDYRHFGASGGEPRQLLDISRQLEDWRAAIAFARTLFARVALFGTSFSGGHVLQLAAEETGFALHPRQLGPPATLLSAVVAQCPMTDGLLAVLKLPPLQSLRLTRAALQDQARALAGRAPKLIRAAGNPGELALMSTRDALPGMVRLTGPDSTWRNAATARVGLRILLYRPGRHAARIACPLLVCICDEDLLVSPGAAAKVAERAPRGEARHYPIGHFDIYDGEWFERAVADQTAFLQAHLAPGR